jgi:hypothetical protein
MTHLDGITKLDARGSPRGRWTRRARFSTAAAEIVGPSSPRQDAAARWGAAAGILTGGLLAIGVGEAEWLAAPVLLGILGWASGRFNSSLDRGAELALTLAPELERRDPAHR